MGNLAQELTRFVVEIKFEELPETVVHEAKRVLLDSIGCALSGITVDKGRIAIELARRLGGPPESSIIGTGDKVSSCSAAFANGELINALDYDTILPPRGHVSPYVIPAPLAMAESVRASGKDLILAAVLGHEISARLARALCPQIEFAHEEREKESIRWLPGYGYSMCIFGGTAGVGKILKLDHKKMSHALGIAGHISPPSTFMKWATAVPSMMTKYGAGGWISTGEITAALLAEMGYIGDTTVFDGEYGFWRFSGSEKWEPDTVMEEIGETWLFHEIGYKPYPCCRVMHGALDCFISIIDKNNIMPEDIESVKVFCHHPLAGLPLWGNNELATHVDAQFSIAYVFAVAAHRVKVGVEWQDPNTMMDPKILEFIRKVNYQVRPGYEERMRKDPRSSVGGMVEVVAKGKVFKEEKIYARGTPSTDVEITDEELVEKFRHNASRILTRNKIEEAIKVLLALETVEDISELIKQITLDRRIEQDAMRESGPERGHLHPLVRMMD